MSKAKAEILNSDSLFNGLIMAYTGGNIGEISNAITKIWNSGEITDEKLRVIKWLVMLNNFTIDYAKTLYKPIPPDDVNKLIIKYTKSKVPAFFRYAKNKDKEQVRSISNSPVDRIRKIYKKRNLSYNFKQNNIGTFDYRVLMKNPDIKIDQSVIDKFRRITCSLNFNITDDKKLFNQYIVYEKAKEDILDNHYSEEEIIDMLIVDLFANRNTPKKKAFWTLFGDTVYNNVSKNIQNNFVQCEKCHQRFYKNRADQHCCSKCRGYEKIGMKTIICCDCGKEIEIDSKSRIIRCKKCSYIARLLKNKKYNNKRKIKK